MGVTGLVLSVVAVHDAALVRVIVPIQSNVDGAEASAEQQAVDLVKTIFPVLPDYIPS